MRNSLLALFLLLIPLVASSCGGAAITPAQRVEELTLPEGAIPFTYQRHLYFEVEVADSVKCRMLFDTGNSHLLFDEAFYADRFADRLPVRRSMLGGAGGGMQQARLAMGEWHYRLGNQTMMEPMAVVMDLRNIVGCRADGMIGMQFMEGRRVEFNYADGYIRLLDDNEKIGTDYTRIPCTWLDASKRRLVMPLTVTLADGLTLDGNFLVDTGMPAALSLTSGTARRLNLLQRLTDARRAVYDVGGVGGSSEEYHFVARRLTVGDHTVESLRASWSVNEQGSLADSRYDGLVGNELLARFDVIFDFAEGTIYLRPNRHFADPQPRTMGVSLREQTDHWVVNGLTEGSNADRAGLRRGDRVEQINGLTPSDFGSLTVDSLPNRLTLQVRRAGELVEIAFDKE